MRIFNNLKSLKESLENNSITLKSKVENYLFNV